MAESSLRIIAGKWRGRKIYFSDAQGLRPSTDRIRETVFNWLMQDLHDADCLDAFAGSGALGFEALSRGASSVVMLDNHHQTVMNLKKNAQKLETENAHITAQDAITFLQQCTTQFDIIFLDPPFSSDLLNKSLRLIKQKNLLKDGGKLYIEYAKNDAIDLTAWTQHKQKTTGQVTYCLLTTGS